VAGSLGFNANQIDTSAINALETAWWTPRGEYFDYEASSDSASAKDIFDKITEAGMSYFCCQTGSYLPGENIKSWTGIITPQDTVEEMQTSFRAPSDDDYDGVDVTYINPVTWAEEIVQCRTTDNPVPRKVESYSLGIVMTADRAYG
jgi:hypothetical protein